MHSSREEGPAGHVSLSFEQMALTAGHVQRRAAGSAEDAVRGPYAGHRVSFDHPPLGVEHVDHRPGAGLRPAGGGDNVPFFVKAHPIDAALGVPPVGAEGVEGIVSAKGAVHPDGVGP